MAPAMRPTSAKRWASAARRSSAMASVRSVKKQSGRAASTEQRRRVAERAHYSVGHGYRDLMTRLGHAGAARLHEHAGKGCESRLAAGQLVEVASEDALHGHLEHTRGRGVEHPDAAALVDGDRRGLHVQQDCALKLVYVPDLRCPRLTHASTSSMSPERDM